MADPIYNTARWQRLRLAHLALHPACEGCKARGVLTRANTVDHILAVSEGGHPFPGHDGLRSYCPACHSAKTARGAEAGAVRSTKPRKGCDADGSPLDPAHPWRTGPKEARGGVRQPERRKGAERGSEGNLEACGAIRWRGAAFANGVAPTWPPPAPKLPAAAKLGQGVTGGVVRSFSPSTGTPLQSLRLIANSGFAGRFARAREGDPQ